MVRPLCLAAALAVPGTVPAPAAHAQDAAPQVEHAAETPPEDTSCRAGSFVREGIALRAGSVRSEPGDPRPFLLADEGSCPVDRGRSCQIGSALSSGESVIVSHSFRQFVCAARTAGGGVSSVGWLPRRSVRTADVDQEPPLDAWPGSWVGGAGTLRLRIGSNPEWIEVEGTALADDGGREDAAAWLNGAARPVGQELVIQDEFGSGCRVSLRLVGSLLFATESGACGGGGGARFEGVYTHAEAGP